MNWQLLGIFVWIAAQLAIGVWASRKVRTEDDYLVAGRSLGYPMATATIVATWFGAETRIGAAGQAAAGGLAETSADPFGYTLCLVLMGTFLARPLWRKKLRTIADLYRARYGAAAERAAVLVMVPTSVLWAAAQIRAFGQVLSASSSLEVHVTIAIAALIVIAYTMVGGMLADAYTDLVQGCVLIVGLVLLGVAAWGAESAPSLVDTIGGATFFSAERSWLSAMDAWLVPVFGSLVAAELVSRVSSSRSADVAQRSAWMASVLYLFIGLIPVSIGLAAADLLGPVENPEQVLIVAAQRFLPGALSVVFAGALVSAILSTVDSALLSAGALFGHNVLAPMLGVVDEAGRLRLDRGCVVGFGVVAWAIAESSEGVYALVEMASSLGTSGLFVLTVSALLPHRRGGRWTALATMATGLLVFLVGNTLGAYEGPFVLSLASAVLVFGLGCALEAAPPEGTASAGEAA